MPSSYRRFRCDLCGTLSREVTRTALANVCIGCIEVMLERTLSVMRRDLIPIAVASGRTATEAPGAAVRPEADVSSVNLAAPVFAHRGSLFSGEDRPVCTPAPVRGPNTMNIAGDTL